MKKVYLVSSTNTDLGYQLLGERNIIKAFTSRRKAKDYIAKEKERVKKENEGLDLKVLSAEDNDVYFYAENREKDWFEIIYMEKELN